MSPAEAASLEALRVLVVDDDELARLMASEVLGAAGMQVWTAASGVEALETVARECPDVVLLDVQMPGMSGLETCQRLRALPGAEDLPILMLTGCDDADAIEAAFAAGATEFASKPVQWLLLRQRLRFLIRAGRSFVSLRQTAADLAERERRLAEAQRIARIGTWEWTLGTDQVLWSEEMFALIPGGDRARPSRLHMLEAIHPEDRMLVEKTIAEAVHHGEGWSLEHRLIGPEGRMPFVQHDGNVMVDPLTGETRVVGTIQDITERRGAEQKIRQLAFYDSLTGLPNRRMFRDRLERLLVHAREQRSRVALLFMDLDRFKWVNDSLGHAAGDRLITEIAARLVNSLRHDDGVFRLSPRANPRIISRFGGDEFVITFLLHDDAQAARKVAQRLLATLALPVDIDGRQVVVTGSIGIAVFPDDAIDVESLLRCADAAMYEAKSRGRNQHQFFTPELSATSTRTLAIQSGLQRAIKEEGFEVCYQPQVAVRTGKLRMFEALVRWHSSELGNVSPAELIPIAEEGGLVLPIGEWVLRRAVRDCRAWQAAGLANVGVAVNLSPVQLTRPGLVELVRDVLAEHRLEPHCLEFEVTETALLDDSREVTQQLDALKEMGVQLALDDFGTGYASLSTLKRVAFDAVKIDREFVRDISSDPGDRAIVSAIVAIARTFGLRVVAEGVETAEHESLIRHEECDAMQGYWISKPRPYEEAIRFVPKPPGTARATAWIGEGRGGSQRPEE